MAFTLILQNQTSNPLSYLSGTITVAANSNVTVPAYQVYPVSHDSQLVSDVSAGITFLSDGVNTYATATAIQYLNQIFSAGLFDVSGSGSITAQQPSENTPVANATVVANLNGMSSVVFNITGTWSGTLNIDATNGDGVWFAVPGVNPANGNQFSAFLNNLQVIVTCGGYAQVRIRCSAFTSGTVNVSYNAAGGLNYISQGAAGSLPSAWPVKLVDNGTNNALTSSQQVGTTATKQAIDTTEIAVAAGYYSAPVMIRQSAATAANATVWSMRNASGSTKTVYIERIFLNVGFDGATPLTRASLSYNLVRFSAATPTSGTAITVVAQDSSASATQVTDVRFVDTGLTTTGVSFGTPFATIINPETDNGPVSQYVREGIALKLAPGEGFCIRLNAAAVIGLSISGEIIWSER